MPILDADAEARHREHAAPLRSRGPRGGAGRLIVLALDATLSRCAAALVAGDAVLARRSEPLSRGHAERIAPLSRALLAEAGLAAAAIDRVAVTTGPGSFTGVRVGLAFARSLALALDRPCLGLSTLEALALDEAGVVAPVIAAPDGVYLAVCGGPRPHPPARLGIEAAAALIADTGARPIGPAAGLLGGPAAPDAPDMVRLGVFAAAAPDPRRFPPEPLYLRAPDARPAAVDATPS